MLGQVALATGAASLVVVTLLLPTPNLQVGTVN